MTDQLKMEISKVFNHSLLVALPVVIKAVVIIF